MMTNQQWAPFKVGDIFPKLNIKKYSSKPNTKGTVPYISCSDTNQGVIDYVDAVPTMTGEYLTVSTNGKNFSTFYHDYPAVCSADVEILQNTALTRDQYLFLIPILELQKANYSYGRKAKNNNVFTTEIYLPATKDANGNIVPDWASMGDYIHSLIDIDEILKTVKEAIKKPRPLWNDNLNQQVADKPTILTTVPTVKEELWTQQPQAWQPFYIRDIFDVYAAKNCLDQPAIVNHGPKIYNYVSRLDKNNGVLYRISKQPNIDPNPGNCLTIGSNSSTIFYQAEPFYTSQNIHIVRCEHLNLYTGLFLLPIFKQLLQKYCWGGHTAALSRLYDDVLYLPAITDANGKIVPDWAYMDDYMHSLADIETILRTIDNTFSKH